MSFVCIKCEKNVLLDPHAAPGALPVVDESKKVPEAVKEEFSTLKEQLVEQLKDFYPELAKYDPKVHIICEPCLESFLFPVEKEVLFEEPNNEEIKKEVNDLKDTIIKMEKQLKEPDDIGEKQALLLRKLVDTEELEEDMETNLKNLATFQYNYEKLEDRYWEDLLTFESELFSADQQRNSVNRQLKSVHDLLDKLDRINVLNDIVHISSDNDVATVNGLAVGKKAMAGQIDWSETNGAIGQLILLFELMEVKCAGMKLDGIKMRPQGSYSEVVRITYENEEIYEMFGPPKDERQFNSGLTVLVEAMTQTHTYLSTKILRLIEGGTYDLPHKITNEDLKYQLFKVDKWTEAMRYFCFNCKHLIYLYGLLNKNNQIALKANKQL